MGIRVVGRTLQGAGFALNRGQAMSFFRSTDHWVKARYFMPSIASSTGAGGLLKLD
jgi:hypothetical protein